MTTFEQITQTERALAAHRFAELVEAFPLARFEQLQTQGFAFYRTTFWYPLDRAPGNPFERVVQDLAGIAKPSGAVTGVEWWFSVLRTDATPQWLLPCHFDRHDLKETDSSRYRYPERASVFYLNTVDYAELVITDQVMTPNGKRPRQPGQMRFIEPNENRYAVFPGHLYHGVIGRMWRPPVQGQCRVSMAVNYWGEQPVNEYMRDSRDSMSAFH